MSNTSKKKLLLGSILTFMLLVSLTNPFPTLAATVSSGCNLTLNITANSNVNYTFTIKNTGQKMCRDASISVYYPDNVSYVSSDPKPTASNYYWRLGNMSPNSQKTISVVTKYTGTESSIVETEACASANNSSDACSSILYTATPTIPKTTTSTTTPTTTSTTTSTTTTPIIQNPSTTSSSEYGTWVWNSPYGMSDAYMNTIINGAVANKINVMYITIDDYLNIYNLPEGPSKETAKIAYGDALEKFIIAANNANIAVDVEAGWRDWAEGTNTYKGNVIIDYAMTYNSQRKNKIRGVEFDVEPYLLPTYETNKATVLKNFVAFVDASTKRISPSNDLKLTFVIPHFYDSNQQWTPSFTYGGITTYTFDHMMRILDTRPGSSIILMSYRNFTLGSDGTVEISKAEIDQASTGNHSTKIIVAQETGNVDPGYVTFYGLSKAEYEKQIALIKSTFANSTNFGGIAVHYIDPFLALK